MTLSELQDWEVEVLLEGHRNWYYWAELEGEETPTEVYELGQVVVVGLAGGNYDSSSRLQLIFKIQENSQDEPKYYAKEGNYWSHDGTYWDGRFSSVRPTKREITEWV